jgi:hypothetical protein
MHNQHIESPSGHTGNISAAPPPQYKGVSMIRVNIGPISETLYIDIILNTIIER